MSTQIDKRNQKRIYKPIKPKHTMYETTYETKLKEMNSFLLLLVDRKPSPDELIRFCGNLIETRRMDRDKIESLQDYIESLRNLIEKCFKLKKK